MHTCACIVDGRNRKEERAHYAHTEEKLKQETRRTGEKCAMRLLDAKAHPELAKRLGIDEQQKQWPVVIAYVRGMETRRVAGRPTDTDIAHWVQEEAWLLNV